MSNRRAIECATKRRVRVDLGEDGRSGLVVFHYLDDPERMLKTITREAFFLNYVADFRPTTSGEIQDSDLPGIVGLSA